MNPLTYIFEHPDSATTQERIDALETHFPAETARIRRAPSLKQAEQAVCDIMNGLEEREGLTDLQKVNLRSFLRCARIAARTTESPGLSHYPEID